MTALVVVIPSFVLMLKVILGTLLFMFFFEMKVFRGRSGGNEAAARRGNLRVRAVVLVTPISTVVSTALEVEVEV